MASPNIDGHYLMLRLMCNSFPHTLHGVSNAVLSIYSTISRINHDCQPNAHIVATVTSEGKINTFIRSISTISTFQEVTISYLSDPFQPFSVRREFLFKSFRFRCMCEACKRDGGMRNFYCIFHFFNSNSIILHIIFF